MLRNCHFFFSFKSPNSTIHFKLETNSLSYKVYCVFSIIGSVYSLNLFSFPWIVSQCTCVCVLVYTCIHVCTCVWRREDTFLTFTFRILALRLRALESVLRLRDFETVFIWTHTHHDLITVGPTRCVPRFTSLVFWLLSISPMCQMFLKLCSHSADLKSVGLDGKRRGLLFLNFVSFLWSLLPQLCTNKTILAPPPLANFSFGF